MSEAAADTECFLLQAETCRLKMLERQYGKSQTPLRACKSSSRDLAAINLTSLNILLDRALYLSCKDVCLEKSQDLQTVKALQENALGQQFALCFMESP